MKEPHNLVFLLAALRGHDGCIKGRVRFEKLVFLLIRDHNIPFEYRFVPYTYGPYSDKFVDHIALLISMGFVIEELQPEENYISELVYRITERGEGLIKNAIKKESINGKIDKIMDAIKAMSKEETQELVDRTIDIMKVEN